LQAVLGGRMSQILKTITMRKVKMEHVPPSEEVHKFNLDRNDDYISQLVITFTDPITYLDVYAYDGNILVDHVELSVDDWEENEQEGVPSFVIPYLIQAQGMLDSSVNNVF
jgi:hypothetical protein